MENLRGEIAERLQQLGASRELHQKQSADYQQALQPGVCGQPCEVYSRVVGYMRPVKQWNPGKRAEFAKRLVFRAPTEEARASEQDDDINKAIDRRFEGTHGY